MKILRALGGLVLFANFAMADTVLENGGAPSFTNMPGSMSASLNSGAPYWDNLSGDFGGSNTADVGYYLTASGNYSSGINYNPTQYLSSGSGGAPPNFNMVRNTNSVLMTLLGSFTGGTEVFGIYDATKTTTATATASEIPLMTTFTGLGATLDESIGAYARYGFYVTNSGNTWFSNTALDVNDGTHQHFALFTTASDPNVYYIGVTDWFYGNGGEGNGDYQDLVIQLNTDAPEPATFALIGAGLLGLGYARLRLRKNRA